MSDVVIRAQGLAKSFREGAAAVQVLRDVNLEIKAGTVTAILGASGSGKSTLLHCLGGLDAPSNGSVEICGRKLTSLSESERGVLRNQMLGFVYQFHHLLGEFTALENVAMPLLIRRTPREEARQQAVLTLKAVGLGHRLDHAPGELSGGERQRCALARALVTKPRCVLADEPTGNLDRDTAQAMFELMLQLQQESGTAFVVVTHDRALAARMAHRLEMNQGTLVVAKS